MSRPLQATDPELDRTNVHPYFCPHLLHIEEERRRRSEQILHELVELVVWKETGEKLCTMETSKRAAELTVDLGLG